MIVFLTVLLSYALHIKSYILTIRKPFSHWANPPQIKLLLCGFLLASTLRTSLEAVFPLPGYHLLEICSHQIRPVMVGLDLASFLSVVDSVIGPLRIDKLWQVPEPPQVRPGCLPSQTTAPTATKCVASSEMKMKRDPLVQKSLRIKTVMRALNWRGSLCNHPGGIPMKLHCTAPSIFQLFITSPHPQPILPWAHMESGTWAHRHTWESRKHLTWRALKPTWALGSISWLQAYLKPQ